MYKRPTLKSSSPWPGAVWTQPVPASSVTCSPNTIGDNLSYKGCCVVIPSNSLPVIVCLKVTSSKPNSAASFSFKHDKKTNVPLFVSYTPYSNLAFKQIAKLAGIVQGVVVQITND